VPIRTLAGVTRSPEINGAAAADAVTSTLAVASAWWPPPLETVTVAVCRPGVANAWVTAALVAVAPSSKLQGIVGVPGPGMHEPSAENPTAWPALTRGDAGGCDGLDLGALELERADVRDVLAVAVAVRGARLAVAVGSAGRQATRRAGIHERRAGRRVEVAARGVDEARGVGETARLDEAARASVDRSRCVRIQ
jgi:hypothetical protein